MSLVEILLLAVAAGLAVALVLLVQLLRRGTRDQADTARLTALAEQAAGHKAALELVDQRLGQLHGQFGQDAHALRDQVGERLDNLRRGVGDSLGESRSQVITLLGEMREETRRALGEQRTEVEAQQARALKVLQDSMRAGYDSLHKQLGESLLRSSTDLGQRVEALTKATDERLKEIGGQVDKRLSDGFEKTTATFADVIKRLALIDEAQKKITALSSEVVSLQELLADKRSRGAFGEVQLAALVGNVLPPSSYALQHRIGTDRGGTDRIADCVLFLPEPTGTICIDAKFPLESFRTITDTTRSELERKRAETQFKQDIKKHIKDISEKYIVRDVTADGAIMFIPAEAVFAEIQAHHPDLVDAAHAARVWLASPTTLWAILNTAAAVLKDAATREQVDIIQKHLGHLADDFGRFRTRMDNLAKHIGQANRDVNEVNISARKISDRFEKIERVELDGPEVSAPEIRQQD
ncbi:MAG: DNA recombination protein RmuC [Gammaproteobacteria bacterium]